MTQAVQAPPPVRPFRTDTRRNNPTSRTPGTFTRQSSPGRRRRRSARRSGRSRSQPDERSRGGGPADLRGVVVVRPPPCPRRRSPRLQPGLLPWTSSFIPGSSSSGACASTVRDHAPRVTVVQQRTKYGSMKADPAATGPETTLEGASVSSDRSRSDGEQERFARDYLRALIKTYPGDGKLVAAAYNAGHGYAPHDECRARPEARSQHA